MHCDHKNMILKSFYCRNHKAPCTVIWRQPLQSVLALRSSSVTDLIIFLNLQRRMGAEESVIDRIEKRKLKWFGHLMRMQQQRWPKRLFQWIPAGRGIRGRPRRSWYQQIKEIMDTRGIQEEDALERERWRLGTGRRLQLQNPCIYIYIYI